MTKNFVIHFKFFTIIYDKEDEKLLNFYKLKLTRKFIIINLAFLLLIKCN